MCSRNPQPLLLRDYVTGRGEDAGQKFVRTSSLAREGIGLDFGAKPFIMVRGKPDQGRYCDEGTFFGAQDM